MTHNWRQRYTFWLKPLSWLFQMVVAVRNKFYDIGIFKTREFPIPILCIGNITVGGTGKTPHTEFLLSILSPAHNVAVLSRGYKRTSKGFLEVELASDVKVVGDEPLQIKNNFPHVRVFVDANRTRAIQKLMSLEDKFDVILLDDGFQHRAVAPGLSIVLMDFNRPVYKDSMLPAGDLREPVSELKRAEMLVVTKTPTNIKPMEQRIISNDLNLFPYQDLYFSTYTYVRPQGLFNNQHAEDENFLADASVLLVTGIAQPLPLLAHLQQFTNKIKHLDFPDHHLYAPMDAKTILREYTALPKPAYIITTQKDAQKLSVLLNDYSELKDQIYFIPIQVVFLTQGKEFTNHILDYVGKNKRKRTVHKATN